jgi:hypothetical protein
MPLTTRQREALRVWSITVQLPRDLPNPPRYFARVLKHLLRRWGVKCLRLEPNPAEHEQ